MKIVVGWDVDDVIYDLYHLMHDACVAAGIGTAKSIQPTSWFPWEEYQCSADEWTTVINAAIGTGHLYGQEPDLKVIGLMYELDKLGVEQHVITARGFLGHSELVREQTEKMLQDYVVPHASLTFTKDKGYVAQALGLTHAIDDNVGNYMAFSEVGVDTYLYDKPWNQSHVVPPARRITDIAQFGRVIKRGSAR